MRNPKRKSLEVLSASIFYLIVAVLSFYIFVELLMPNNTVKIFGFKPYSVITDSMEPIIDEGDFIIVVNPKFDELNPEDIITFYADYDGDGQKEVITHYIDKIYDDGEIRTYQTKGYDKPYDSWVITNEDILGVYSFKIPKLGSFVEFLKTPYGIVILSLILVLIIVMKAKIKEKKSKTES